MTHRGASSALDESLAMHSHSESELSADQWDSCSQGWFYKRNKTDNDSDHWAITHLPELDSFSHWKGFLSLCSKAHHVLGLSPLQREWPTEPRSRQDSHVDKVTAGVSPWRFTNVLHLTLFFCAGDRKKTVHSQLMESSERGDRERPRVTFI